jgi:hypothetical protein
MPTVWRFPDGNAHQPDVWRLEEHLFSLPALRLEAQVCCERHNGGLSGRRCCLENECMNTSVLSQHDYEALVAGGLRQAGLTDDQVSALLAARWPLFLPDLLAEAGGRGRLLTADDVAEWLQHRFGQQVDPNELAYHPAHVDELLAWACEHDIGRPTFAGWAATMRPNTVEAILRRECAPNN